MEYWNEWFFIIINITFRCLRIIQKLEPNHKKIWYDYTRLKYYENKNLKDEKQIKRIIEEGIEQIDWVKSILNSKKQKF